MIIICFDSVQRNFLISLLDLNQRIEGRSKRLKKKGSREKKLQYLYFVEKGSYFIIYWHEIKFDQ